MMIKKERGNEEENMHKMMRQKKRERKNRLG